MQQCPNLPTQLLRRGPLLLQASYGGHDVLLTAQAHGFAHRSVIRRAFGLLPKQALLGGVQTSVKVLRAFARTLNPLFQQICRLRLHPIASPVAVLALQFVTQMFELLDREAAHQARCTPVSVFSQRGQTLPDFAKNLAGLLFTHILQRHRLELLQPLRVSGQLRCAVPLLVGLQVVDQHRPLLGADVHKPIDPPVRQIGTAVVNRFHHAAATQHERHPQQEQNHTQAAHGLADNGVTANQQPGPSPVENPTHEGS